MKVLLLALLAFSALPSFAADEEMTVTGSRIRPGQGPLVSGTPGVRPGRTGLEKPKFDGNEGGGQPTVRTPEGKYCPARFAKENKPTPLCGSYGELPTFGRGNFNQTYLKCEGEAEYLWKEVFLGCSDPT